MTKLAIKDQVLINVDCFSEVMSIDNKILKVTLNTGEQMNIPAAAFGVPFGCAKLPKIVPVSGMYAWFNFGDSIRRCPLQMMAVTGGMLRPMAVDLGQIVYLADMDGFIGGEINPDLHPFEEEVMKL